MSKLYDDEMIKVADEKVTHALKTRTIPANPFIPGSGLGLSVAEIVKVALDAAAPLIVAAALRRVGLESGSITDAGLYRLADEIEKGAK